MWKKILLSSFKNNIFPERKRANCYRGKVPSRCSRRSVKTSLLGSSRREHNTTNTSAWVLLFILTEKSSPSPTESAYFGATTENAREKHENHIGMKKKERKTFPLSRLPNNENSVVSERSARNKNWNVDCGWTSREREGASNVVWGEKCTRGKCRAKRVKISIGVGRKNPEKDKARGRCCPI